MNSPWGYILSRLMALIYVTPFDLIIRVMISLRAPEYDGLYSTSRNLFSVLVTLYD